ncbi:class I poly(R)-hydroxyalkanoic acid synthase [Sphingosinicella sp. LHD-64]|uniref:PHA/PHB synthase family protein n=1 Tax=Sphingosinicella sp. LHD-64 TaxID=3072139 RepID=UPI00280FA298|nr:class I poly(R)-hydroxyalkanoic acid synthase [Sphingosinicella sp. LHD-64]MDQ8756637.1 class I poly(R)-hydroxyalkanoic acid synthase [Sphingosinicella sp. LHD-64]
MAEQTDGDSAAPPPFSAPSLEDIQHWTFVMGRAQQMMLEHLARHMGDAAAGLPSDPERMARTAFAQWSGMSLFGDPAKVMQQQAEMWTEGLAIWQRALGQAGGNEAERGVRADQADRDRRFAAPEWRGNPLFDTIRQTYLLISERLLGSVDAIEGVDEATREKIRFNTKAFIDAMAPSNFALTNPQVLARAMETKGESLLRGLEHMLKDLSKGQLTHTDPEAFEVGRNVATTPGKVVRQTKLYQLIQYAPATGDVFETPLIIFPPWINRFYILDLNPRKSFIRWAVEQGLTVFVVSWKSADESLTDVTLDDYVLAQIDAIDAVREGLGVENVHAIGYCVAGTTLAATLALLDARGQAETVASATFLTAQVDFSEAGDLRLFVSDEQMELIRQLSAGKGYLDGRYMAATFNLLRGRDLIWSYVTNNYLLGEEYPQFDLLFWNGDTTNLPARWHQAYLTQLYRENRLVQPGAVTIDGTPIDLRRVKTPVYIQAGREDHIAPPQSVWKITHHFQGPLRFVLAGSGHIAGVVNPPGAGKYQYWINEAKADTLEAFIAGATETKGSWWPDWLRWLEGLSDEKVLAAGVREPGKGRLKAIEDAPGSYVRAR